MGRSTNHKKTTRRLTNLHPGPKAGVDLFLARHTRNPNLDNIKLGATTLRLNVSHVGFEGG